MKILGLSFGYHDSTACLLVDGRVVGCSAEERFSRKKHDNGFPSEVIDFCLAQEGLRIGDIDAVAYYEMPGKKLERIWKSIHSEGRARAITFVGILRKMNERGALNPLTRICEKLNIGRDKVHAVLHHESHRALALYGSGFNSTSLLTIDGVGEFETTTLSHSNPLLSNEVKNAQFPDSLGFFYAAITAFLGFEVNEAEYKVMGLASYGEPSFVDALYESLKPQSETKQSLSEYFSLNGKYYNTEPSSLFPYATPLLELLGLPASNSDEYSADILELKTNSASVPDVKRYADIAHSAQRVLENMVLDILEKERVEKNHGDELAFGGGVALNCKLNKSLMDNGYKLFIAPDPGDGGSAIGSAMMIHHRLTGKNPEPISEPYLGYRTDDEEICATLESFQEDIKYTIFERSELSGYVADKIASGSIVGWFQGRSEFGPRALGNRSILADPRRIETQEYVNIAIKFREEFRPFAPSILEEYADDYFELSQNNRFQNSSYHYMLSLAKAKQRAIDEIPAVVHVDGTTRPQLVVRELNPNFHSLIEKFQKLSGVPALLNTSFNLRGEPIVNRPVDAMRTFLASGLDYLVIENFVIEKNFRR
tara:strand:- start:1391 stop:3178 length:1788 start_codon:yes stop_codon:yes gene_type:complete